jgi:hypothetical protein
MNATTATAATVRMNVPMRETPCDHCNDKAITRAFAWKDEDVRLWVGFCSKSCRDAFCEAR